MSLLGPQALILDKSPQCYNAADVLGVIGLLLRVTEGGVRDSLESREPRAGPRTVCSPSHWWLRDTGASKGDV